MVWARRMGYAFAGLLILLLAGAGWVWYAKPWIPKAELINLAPDGSRITDDGLFANYYPPTGTGRQPAILVLGGSEGGLGSEMTGLARALQGEGYAALHRTMTRPQVQLLDYPDACHYAFGVPLDEKDPRYSLLYVLGGSNKGTNAALTDSWAKTRIFLSESLQPAP